MAWGISRGFVYGFIVQFSCSIMLTLYNPMDCSTPGLPVHHELPELTQTHVHRSVMPSNHLILCHLLLLLPSIFPASRSLPMSEFFTSGDQSIGASASVFPMKIQDWFPLEWLVWSLCSPRDSQEYSPILHFKSINSSALSFLYGTTLRAILDYWENYSFKYTDLCWQSNVSAF